MQRKQTEPYLATYLHSKGRKMGLPIAGNFEMTARCNFNCPMCYVHMSEDEVAKQGKELTAEQWIKIAEDAKEKGMVFALLTGGEPFVRKDFFEIYGAMKKMGLLVSINSNGSMLEGEILEKLLADPPVRMNISLYGGCEETYKNMCGLPMYERVLNNIIRLRKAGVSISLNLSITPYNCQDLEKIYEIVDKYQINVRASSYMYPPIRLEKELEGYAAKSSSGDQANKGYGNRLSPEDSAKYSVQWDRLRFTDEEFRQRAEAMKNLTSIEPDECYIDAEETSDGVKCRAGSSSFWMTWDGEMRPCGMMPGPTAYPMESGFDAAWEEIREATSAIRQPAKCAACPKAEICGTCAAVCVSETGSFEGVPEYMCQRTDEILKQTAAAVEMTKE